MCFKRSIMQIPNDIVRLTLPILSLLFAFIAFVPSTNGQVDATELANGDMEILDSRGMPEDWGLYSQNKVVLDEAGVSYEVDTARPATGENCLLIDARELKISSVGAWQYFHATEFAGERVRVGGAIRLDALEEDVDETNEDEAVGFAGLTIQAYRIDASGAFRPVAYEVATHAPSENDNWKRSVIVIDVPTSAEVIEIGIEVSGKTRAWFDDISLEVVDEDMELTKPAAGFDYPQSFFSWWMIYPIIAVSFFIVGFCGSGPLQRFALRFSVSYWVIYFVDWWLGLVRFTEIDFTDFYQAKAEIVSWFTWTLFQKDVYPFSSGSSDGIYNYAELLSIFVYSVGVAIVWSFLDWRRTDSAWLKDLLRSFLRYSLAIVLLTYGLGKVYPEFTQFPAPSFDRLNITYGESSPMGLLWTFMGASQPYTIFAGLGEVLAALLLIWRRTTMVGAFVAIGVMTNVVMLNFCYDVPVKLFSTHLLIASFVVLVPDLSRISKMFLTHSSLERAELRPPFVSRQLVWVHRVLKMGVIGIAILFPTYQTIDSWGSSKSPDFFGDYAVQENSSASQDADLNAAAATESDETSDSGFKKFNFVRLPYAIEKEQQRKYTDLISIATDTGTTNAIVELDIQKMEMKIVDFQGRKRNLPSNIKIKVIDEDLLELSGQISDGPWLVKLRRRKGEFLLSSRGFRWVNPRPFNR